MGLCGAGLITVGDGSFGAIRPGGPWGLVFRDVFTGYLGVDSPIFAPLAARGLTLPGPAGQADIAVTPHGAEVGTATHLPGASFTRCHEECLDELLAICSEAGWTHCESRRASFERGTSGGACLAGRPPAIIPDAAIVASLPSLHGRYVSTVSVTQLETLFLTVSVGSHSPAQAIRRSS